MFCKYAKKHFLYTPKATRKWLNLSAIPHARLCTIFGPIFDGEANHSAMNFEGMGFLPFLEKFITL
jgi:hypothetical protein